MFLRHAACAATLGLLCAAPARGEELQPGSLYLGPAIGTSRSAGLPQGVYKDAVLGLSGGYIINGTLAVEVFEQSFLSGPLSNALSSVLDTVTGGVDTVKLPERHWGVAAVGGVHLADSVRLLGRVGVGRTRLSVYGSPKGAFQRAEQLTDPSLGLALSWDTSARWSFSLNTTRFKKTRTTTSTLGTQVRF